MKHTLDIAQDQFRVYPNCYTAGLYQATAAEYAADGMIAADTFVKIIAEVTEWLLSTTDLRAIDNSCQVRE